MTDTLKTISPVDGSIQVARAGATEAGVASALARARDAQAVWKHIVVEDRAARRQAAVETFVAKQDAIAEEIPWRIGRPIRLAPGEAGGPEHRARPMIAVAPEAPVDVTVEPQGGFTRFIRREPVGVVFVVASWN